MIYNIFFNNQSSIVDDHYVSNPLVINCQWIVRAKLPCWADQVPFSFAISNSTGLWTLGLRVRCGSNYLTPCQFVAKLVNLSLSSQQKNKRRMISSFNFQSTCTTFSCPHVGYLRVPPDLWSIAMQNLSSILILDFFCSDHSLQLTEWHHPHPNLLLGCSVCRKTRPT